MKCESRGNVYTSVDQFVDRANYDYHLKSGSLAIDAGINPGSAPNGFSLSPDGVPARRRIFDAHG